MKDLLPEEEPKKSIRERISFRDAVKIAVILTIVGVAVYGVYTLVDRFIIQEAGHAVEEVASSRLTSEGRSGPLAITLANGDEIYELTSFPDPTLAVTGSIRAMYAYETPTKYGFFIAENPDNLWTVAKNRVQVEYIAEGTTPTVTVEKDGDYILKIPENSLKVLFSEIQDVEARDVRFAFASEK